MDEWRDEIIRRLAAIFPVEADDGENLTAVIWYLNHQDEVNQTGSNVQPSEWMSLRQLLEIPAAFERYARRLLSLTVQLDDNQEANQARPEPVPLLNDAQWRDEIIRRLAVAFPAEADNGERLIAVLWHLNRQDEVYRDSDVQPPEWVFLRQLLEIPLAFEGYARRLFDRTVQNVAYHEANPARPEIIPPPLNDAQWREQIIGRLSVVFPPEADDGERLIAVLWYLNRQDEVYRDSDVQPPEWMNLRQLLNATTGFKVYAHRLFDRTRQIDTYQEANRARLELVSQFNDGQGENTQSDDQRERNHQSWWKHLLEGFASYDPVFAFVHTTAVVSYNMRRWLIGEITGDLCAKNIIDATLSFAGGVAGFFAGATFGASAGTLVFGPFGTIIGGLLGGILGGLAGSYTARRLSDYLTRLFFSIPREEALANAYAFFGVQQNVEEDELREAFNRARRRDHPDRGGRHEDFLQLQMHWEVIRVAREARRERRQRGRRQEQPRANAQVQREPIALQYY